MKGTDRIHDLFNHRLFSSSANLIPIKNLVNNKIKTHKQKILQILNY